MTTLTRTAPSLSATDWPRPWIRRARLTIGGFYFVMAGINIGLLISNPQIYAAFGEHPLFGFVHEGWQQIVMAHPLIWIGLLAAGEIVVGASLITGGVWARAGYVVVILFHLLLLVFGFFAWAWALPVLAVVIPIAREEFRQGTPAVRNDQPAWAPAPQSPPPAQAPTTSDC